MQPGLFTGVMHGHRHVIYGLVRPTLQRLKANTILSQNHEVVEQNNLFKTFRTIKFLTRGLFPLW